jgi:hypothetical protein
VYTPLTDAALATIGFVLLLTPTGSPPSLGWRRWGLNRRRHDAARIIERFGGRLRDQVDLDTLTAEVLAVATQTMQPTRASLWLRPPP